MTGWRAWEVVDGQLAAPALSNQVRAHVPAWERVTQAVCLRRASERPEGVDCLYSEDSRVPGESCMCGHHVETDPVLTRNYTKSGTNRVFGEVALEGKTTFRHRFLPTLVHAERVRILSLYGFDEDTVELAKPVACALDVPLELISDLEFLALVIRYQAPHRDQPMHGQSHWACVSATTLDLCDEVPDADRLVAFLFGLLHDSRRDLNGPKHAPAGAAYARELVPRVLELEPDRANKLYDAIARHASGGTSDDPTIAVCLDADRLHLTRGHTNVHPGLLSTDAAKQPGAVERAAKWREAPPSWRDLVNRL